ncbi:unnamed protein product [Orchesella dallaii]|uniref:Gustatory receptor n=1 Tax=Orchesella dallaii TaxID=48710 RepID=A0ABP1S692_9HEXA
MSAKGSKRGERKISNTTNCGEADLSHFTLISKRQSPVIETTSVELEHSTFHVFILLEPFLNVCFFLLLIPFRIVKNSQGFYERKRNLIQQIFSTLVIVLVLTYYLLDLRMFVEYNLKDDPKDVFRRATGVLFHMIPLCWVITFWWRATSFDDILSHLQHHRLQRQLIPEAAAACITSKKSGWKLIWFLKITLLLTFARLFNILYYLWEGSVECCLNHVISRALYNLYISKDFISIETEDRLNSTVLNSASYALVPIHVLFEFIPMIFEQFCLTGAVMVFAACEKFSKKFQSLRTHKVIKGIFSCYLDLDSTVESINNIFGPSILLFIMRLYPLFIWSTINRIGVNSVSEILMKVWDVVIIVLLVAIAAGANGKLNKYKRWLFHASLSESELSPHQLRIPRSSLGSESVASVKDTDTPIFSHDAKIEMKLELAAMHREMSTEVIGLKGCNLFTITPSFILSMIGILITYTIVLLQFMTTPKENDPVEDSIIKETYVTDNSTEESIY